MIRTALNSLTIAFGAAAGQLIGLLAMPVLVRLYDPAAFGVFSVFLSAVTVVSGVASARYEQAIVLARSDRAAAALAQLAFLIAFFVCLATMALLRLSSVYLDEQLKIALGWQWLLVGVVALPTSFLTTLTMIGVRYEQYRLISASRTTKVCISAISQIVAGMSFLPLVGGLIVGEFLGNAATAVGGFLALRLLHEREGRRFSWFWKRILWRDMLLVARKFADFAKINTPHVFVNGAVGWLTLLVIGMLFSARELGYYYLMQRIAMAPASLAGAAVSQVYYREATIAARNEGNFLRPMFRVILMQLTLGVPFGLLLFYFGSDVFAFAFGNEWKPAGRLAEVFAPFVVLHLVLASLPHTTIIADRQLKSFVVEIFRSLLFMGGFLLGAKVGGDLEAGVRGATLVSVFYMLGTLLWYVELARASHKTPQPIRAR